MKLNNQWHPKARVKIRRKMKHIPSELGNSEFWYEVYNHNGEEINPIEIQKQIDERTAMTSWVRSGQSTTIELNKRLFLTVDDRGKQPTVFLHTSSNPTHTQKFPKGIRTLPNLKVARRYARELLDGTPIVSKSA